MEIVTHTDVDIWGIRLWSWCNHHSSFLISHSSFEVISGGYCSGVPPLPIPNREVKPACADGTAMQCGRVGGRLLYIKREALSQQWLRASFVMRVLLLAGLAGRCQGLYVFRILFVFHFH